MANSIRYLFLILIFFGLHSISFSQQDASQRESSKIKKLSMGADVIITGKVSHNKSGWNENKTRIYTKTTVQVKEYIKGQNNGSYMEIMSPGGEVGEVGELYTHMPRFEDNEEVLVFLKQDGKNKQYKVLSGEEGKITVVTDGKTDDQVTRSNMQLQHLISQIKSFVNTQK